MLACLIDKNLKDIVPSALALAGLRETESYEAVSTALNAEGYEIQDGDSGLDIINYLAGQGYVEFKCAGGALTIKPLSNNFQPVMSVSGTLNTTWKLSKFQYVRMEDGDMTAHSPLANCMLKIHDHDVLGLIARFNKPCSYDDVEKILEFGNRLPIVMAALAQARIILPCDASGKTEDDLNPDRRMWDFHELLFHSRSRLGRSGSKIGATWDLKDEIEKPPVVKPNVWTGAVIPLYRPSEVTQDLSLFEAMETRRSIRNYSSVPLTSVELGEFLFRTMRVKYHENINGHEITSRPYPNGGGIYEQELYVTIDACLDIPRGVYYYDAVNHQLCHVIDPCSDMELLLEEASMATARTGRAQILFTIASRFGAFNWKYSAMSYAAQLKNVGVIYQTMYLVATAMGIGACGLGVGNADRFSSLTGLDYLEEGSIGEFMIGRPI